MKKLLILSIILSKFIFAAPAYQGEMEFKQKDGTVFKGELKGDEHFSWIEDSQEDVIKYNNESKNYEYAELKEQESEMELVPSGVKVTPEVQVQLSSSENNITSMQGERVKIDKSKLYEIWKEKRQKALNERINTP